MASAGGRVQARVVRPGATKAEWMPMVVAAHDQDWDVALLAVNQSLYTSRGTRSAAREWLTPSSPSPTIVRLGTSAEPGCETVGFPQSEIEGSSEGTPASAVRQTEQAQGNLLAAGQGKIPAHPDRHLPRRWMPLDVETATPGTQDGWGGMSGAGVILPDGRLAGLVVAAEADHQQRRLYVVPLAEAISGSPHFAQALGRVLNRPVIIEARNAPLYRDILRDGCLGADGLPLTVAEADLGAFGVKAAGIPSEPSYLEYIPRDDDNKLSGALQTARAERRMLLVVGGSAGGKSRSAAEAARQLLPGSQLLFPRQTSLARLRQLDLGPRPALVWLDDAERFDERAFRDTVDWLLHSGVMVVATIRRTELEARMPTGDLRNPLGEALTDPNLVVQMGWSVKWSADERSRVRQHVKYPQLLTWVADGNSPSAWAVAGPQLVDRLRLAETNDELPVRYALMRTVLDWNRTGIARPIPKSEVSALVSGYLADSLQPTDLADAFQWAFQPVMGQSHRTAQSLLVEAQTQDGLTVHEYVQDADARSERQTVPDVVWMSALRHAITSDERYNIGYAASVQRNTNIARRAWLPMAERGEPYAMYALALLLQSTEPDPARGWYQKAAQAGVLDAMNDLGLLLQDTEPDQARAWLEKAARAGNTKSMFNLANLLLNTEPDQARGWYRKAADAGHPAAMNNLGYMLLDTEPDQARGWYQKAAEAGHAGAMASLGHLLQGTEPAQARSWYKKAAQLGIVEAMANLGVLLLDTEPDQARAWLEKAADAGNTKAMFNLQNLLQATDPGQARAWLEKAADVGDSDAMFHLGGLLLDTQPGQARVWLERAAKADNTAAMAILGRMPQTDPRQVRDWLDAAADDATTMLRTMKQYTESGQLRSRVEKAAEAGDTGAMATLGLLLLETQPGQARVWLERAAQAGDTGAMAQLGLLLRHSEPGQARAWLEKAAQASDITAAFYLGILLLDTEPAQARAWLERAADEGNTEAMNALGILLQDAEPTQARNWYQKAADAGDSDAMFNLANLLLNTEPDQARGWYQKAADAGDTNAMTNLGVLLQDIEPAQARRWWHQAAQDGNTTAMFNLAMLLQATEPGQALDWLEKAAQAGQPDAASILSTLQRAVLGMAGTTGATGRRKQRRPSRRRKRR